MTAGWPSGTLMNVNFPACPADQVKGFKCVPQGKYDLQSTEIEERTDARQRAYYWIGIERRPSKPPEGTDLWAARSNLISVTPLYLNFTHEETRSRLSKVLGH